MTMSINDIKKELMKSKALAYQDGYVSGNLYYKVEIQGSTYRFPIATVEKNVIKSNPVFKDMVEKRIEFLEGISGTFADEELEKFNVELDKLIALSPDLGTTFFASELRASELNRWIGMAFASGDFVKVS